jgi:hypothetical protein
VDVLKVHEKGIADHRAFRIVEVRDVGSRSGSTPSSPRDPVAGLGA